MGRVAGDRPDGGVARDRDVWFRGRRLLPDSLTALRPVLGLASAVALVAGAPLAGGWCFLAGYATDVVDGLVARALGVSSAAGTRLDGIADVAFGGLVGPGLVVRGAVDGTWAVVALMVGMQVAGRLLPRWVGVHTVVGKAVGGANRVVFLACFLLLSPPGGGRQGLALAGGVLLAGTYAYEAVVTMAEHRTGERTLR